MLVTLTADDPESPLRLTAFVQGLQELGWAMGRNVRIDTRWGAGDPNRYRSYAAKLVALAPDVILASGGGNAPEFVEVGEAGIAVDHARRSEQNMANTVDAL